MSTKYRHLPFSQVRYSAADMRRRAKDFQELMSGRRSVRFLSSEPVPRKLLEVAIETASSAPSGAHRQPWTFVAVSYPELKREIRIAAEKEEELSYGGRMPPDWLAALAPLGTNGQKPFLEEAPWLVVVFAQLHNFDSQGRKIKHYYVQESVGIACGMFIAALHNMGLSTLTHTPSPMRFLSRLLQRPAHERPYILFPIGYAAKDATIPDLRRKALEEVAIWK